MRKIIELYSGVSPAHHTRRGNARRSIIHHNLLDKLKYGGFAEIELIAVSINSRSRSTLNGLGKGFPLPLPLPSSASKGFTHRTYADANALRTHTLAGELCKLSTAARIGLFEPGGKVGSQRSAISR